MRYWRDDTKGRGHASHIELCSIVLARSDNSYIEDMASRIPLPLRLARLDSMSIYGVTTCPHTSSRSGVHMYPHRTKTLPTKQVSCFLLASKTANFADSLNRSQQVPVLSIRVPGRIINFLSCQPPQIVATRAVGISKCDIASVSAWSMTKTRVRVLRAFNAKSCSCFTFVHLGHERSVIVTNASYTRNQVE
jgi:hypothetical protein